MSNWRNRILQEFHPEWSLLAVADPDYLFRDEQILADLHQQGFTVRPYTPGTDDPVRLRYEFERDFRSRWDSGDGDALIIVVCGRPDARSALPYAITKHVERSLCFRISDLFPKLDPVVLRTLRGPELDKLDIAIRQHPSGTLGEKRTRDFVLRHVLGFAPELITSEAEVLQFLLAWHYGKLVVDPALCRRILEHLQSRPFVVDWPLANLLSSRADFLTFLQRRWEEYVDTGTSALPLAHEQVRAYMDTYFLDGLLRPVAIEAPESSVAPAMRMGVVYDAERMRASRQRRLEDACRQTVPAATAPYQEWFAFADRWAQLQQAGYLEDEVSADQLPDLIALRECVDERFRTWLQNRYQTLYNQPAITPAMVHHIPHTLAYERERDDVKKVALVVVDGLSLLQWLTIAPVLQRQQPDLFLQQETVFAWIPSITEVSRQALFAGEWPGRFADSIERTDKEPLHWERFWAQSDIPAQAVHFRKGLGLGPVEELQADLGDPRIQVAGLVVDTVDELAHKAILGTRAYGDDVRRWAEKGYLAGLLAMLVQNGFRIYLTADHGQVAAMGVGTPKQDGHLAITRVKRMRRYSSEVLRDRAAAQSPGAVIWKPEGLPPDYFPLFPPGRTAFTDVRQQIVGHGALTLEEVLVPFVRITRRTV